MYLRILKRSVAILLVSIMLLSGTVFADENQFEMTRLSGDSRIKTALEVSKNGFDSSEYVLIANGFNFPDALAGGPLAVALKAPILLTAQEQLEDEVLKEVIELGASKAIILGSEGSISQKVSDQLSVVADVERIGGEDRYETAALIANRVLNITGATSIAVTNGQKFPDALSASAYLGDRGMPIVLVTENSVPAASRMILNMPNVKDTVILGGEKTVSNDVFDELPNAERISGNNRYDTAIELSKKAFSSPKNIIIANGLNFPDALSAAALSGVYSAPIILTDADSLPGSVKDYLEEVNPSKVLLVGGRGSISSSVAGELLEILGEINKPKVPVFENNAYNDDYAKQMADIINDIRVEKGLNPLVWDEGLIEAAKIRAKEIEDKLSHTRPNGLRFETVNEAQVKGENLAIIAAHPQDVIDIMMSTSGQSGNILRDRADFKAIGVACWVSENGSVHWVQVFGLTK